MTIAKMEILSNAGLCRHIGDKDMAKISNRHIKAWQKFNDELNAFILEVEDDPMNTAIFGLQTLQEYCVPGYKPDKFVRWT